jgi:acetylornithine deacetylase/succinyl-diaminopimelate desuccinylase-like protein
VANQLASALQSVTGRKAEFQGVSFGTDAFCYDAAGVPSVVFGPGSIDQAHTADEWVPLAEVRQAADVLYQLVMNWHTH